jgi:hypothetical protein
MLGDIPQHSDLNISTLLNSNPDSHTFTDTQSTPTANGNSVAATKDTVVSSEVSYRHPRFDNAWKLIGFSGSLIISVMGRRY